MYHGAPTYAMPNPAMAGINHGWVAATANPSATDDLAFATAVECKNTDAWSVDHVPVMHHTAMHSELEWKMLYFGSTASPFLRRKRARARTSLGGSDLGSFWTPAGPPPPPSSFGDFFRKDSRPLLLLLLPLPPLSPSPSTSSSDREEEFLRRALCFLRSSLELFPLDDGGFHILDHNFLLPPPLPLLAPLSFFFFSFFCFNFSALLFLSSNSFILRSLSVIGVISTSASASASASVASSSASSPSEGPAASEEPLPPLPFPPEGLPRG
mmetsp:Transcript_6454/g.18992  ORF Transcript_6454/g.18992 Transcript_6454/m.18992 type:complete len:269 (+) Transcript_6454:210-1016(+)